MKDKKKIILIVILSLIIFCVILLIGSFIISRKNAVPYNSTSTNGKVLGSNNTIFFLPNSKDQYALFDANGNRLTDFKYDIDLTDYSGDVWAWSSSNSDDTFEYQTKAIKERGKYTIIDRKGNNIITPGYCSKVEKTINGIILCKNGNNLSIFDNTGKEKAKLELQEGKITDSYLTSRGGDDYFAILINNTLYLIDKDGNIFDKFDASNTEPLKSTTTADFLTDYYKLSSDSYYKYVSYKTGSTIYSKDNKKIASNNHGACEFTSYYEGKLVSEECDYRYYLYKLDNNGNLNQIGVYDYFAYGSNILIEINNNTETVIDINGNKTDISYNSSNNDIEELNSTNFAVSNIGFDECKKVDTANHYINFYVDYKLVKKVDNACVNEVKSTGDNTGYYIVKENNLYTLYDKNGNKHINESYEYLEPDYYNKNVLIASNNNKKFLVDLNGKKISNNYDDIYSLSNTYNNDIYYYFKEDGKWGILNNKLDVVIPNVFISNEDDDLTFGSDYSILDREISAIGKISKNKNAVYSSKSGKIFEGSSDDIELYDYYIAKYINDSSNSKIEIYTLYGKKFYEIEN